MRDAIAGNAPGRSRHGVLPQVSALIRLRWPVLSRRLLITAGAFLAAYVAIALLVHFGAFDRLNLRMTHYLQGRGSTGQDIGLGIFSYLGSIEVTLVLPQGPTFFRLEIDRRTHLVRELHMITAALSLARERGRI